MTMTSGQKEGIGKFPLPNLVSKFHLQYRNDLLLWMQVSHSILIGMQYLSKMQVVFENNKYGYNF